MSTLQEGKMNLTHLIDTLIAFLLGCACMGMYLHAEQVKQEPINYFKSNREYMCRNVSIARVSYSVEQINLMCGENLK